MADLSVVLGADTSRLTKNLNDAKKILNEYSNSSKSASNTINKFTGINDSQVESFRRVVKSLEQVQSGSLATSKAEKQLANQIKELKIQWANLSDTAKSSDFGKSISDSIQSAESQLKEFRQQLKAANEQIKTIGQSSSSGSDFGLGDLKSALSSIKSGDINGIAESLNKFKSIDLGSISKNLFNIGAVGEGAGASIGAGMTAALGPIATVAAAVAGVGLAIKSASNFEVHLDALQSLTGMTDTAMKDVSDGAIQMSNKYSTAASDIVDAMSLIGSQAPDLLKNSDALMSVTDAANMLSVAAGIQVTDAAKGITTAMNQMGVSAGAATDVVNLLAAASQQGSAGVEYLNTAIEKSAAQAASSGMSYSQLVSSIEGVAPLFSSADVAGSQLSSTLLSLAVSSEDKFKPSVVGLNQALTNLADAEMDDAKMKDLVGESNITMLKALINNRDAIKGYQSTLVGTQTAQEQMATNTDNLETSFKSLGVQCENMFITLGQTGIIQDLMSVISALIGTITDIFDAVNQTTKSFDGFQSIPNIFTPIISICELLGQTVKNVATVIEVAVRLIAKVWNWVSGVIKTAWKSAMSYITNTSWYKTLKVAWNACIKWFSDTVNKLKDLWDKFKKWLGMDVKTGEIKVKGLDGKGVEDISKGNSNTNSVNSKGNSNSSNSNSNSKSNSTVQPKAVSGSLTDLENKLNELNRKYKDGLVKITPEDYKSQVQKLESEINDKKIQLGLIPNVDDKSLQSIESQLSKKNNELKVAVDQSTRKKIQSEIKELTDKKNTIEFDLKFDDDKYKKLVKSIEKPTEKPSAEFETSNVSADGEAGKKLKENNEQINKNNAELDRLAGLLPSLEEEYAKLGEQIKQASELNIDTSKEVEAYNELGDAISNVKDEMVNLKDANGGIIKQNKKIEKGIESDKKQMEELDATTSTISSMSSAFGNLGKAIGGSEGQMLSMFSTMLQGMADLIPQIVKLIGAKEAEAIASGTASAASAKPWFMVIPQIAAVVGTITGIFSGLSGSFANGGIVPKFADGGIFSGSTSVGDMNLARVNSGEMILNGSQQSKLFRMLNEPGSSNLYSQTSDVNFKIKGKDLVGVINNYSKKVSKVK